MNRLLFNLISGLLVALVISVAAAVVASFLLHPGSSAVKSMNNAQWLSWVALWVTVFSPLWPLVTPLFAFVGVDVGDEPKARFVGPLVGAVVIAIAMSALAVHLGAEMILQQMRDREVAVENALLAERVKSATDLTAVESRYQRNPTEAPAVIRELEQKAFAFPFQFETFELLDRIKKSETEKIWVKSEPGRAVALTGAEARATEARNRRDFATAALHYRQCLDRIPNTRPFAAERSRLNAALETVLEMERNPGSTLTDAQQRDKVLRERMLALDALLDQGNPFTAFPMARDLRLEHPHHPEVLLRYQRAEKELRGDEFLVQDAILFKTMLPESPALTAVRFEIDGGLLSAERMQWAPGGVYLERPQWHGGKTHLTFAWGRVTGDRLQLKQADFEKSRVEIIPGLHTLQGEALYTVAHLKPRLSFRSPLRLETHRHFVAENLSKDDFFFRFLRELRWFLPVFLLGAGLLVCGMTWWNREHLVDPFYILTAAWAMVFSTVIYSMVVYTGAIHETHSSLAAMRSVTGGLCGAFIAGGAVFFAKGS